MGARLTKADIIESACTALTHPRTEIITIIIVIIIIVTTTTTIILIINIIASACTALPQPQILEKEHCEVQHRTHLVYIFGNPSIPSPSLFVPPLIVVTI